MWTRTVSIAISTTACVMLAALYGASAGPAGGRSEVQPAPPADIILHNGNFWTANARSPSAEAVAIRDGKFVAIGANKEVIEHRGVDTHMIDLKGAFAVPGFNDSHVHFSSAARFLEFNIMKAGRQSEFVERVRYLAGSLPKGEWILGGFWGAYDQWAEGSAGGERRGPFAPDMRLVDRTSRDHPIFIQKFDRSEYAANSAALRALGIDPQNPKAANIEFVRDAAGFTGRLRGDGIRGLLTKVPRTFSRQRRLLQTKHALKVIAGFGVTSVSDMSDDEQLSIYRELHRKGELTVRVDFRYPLDRWKELADQGVRVGGADEWIHLGGLKGHIDGIMGTSTARFFEPYTHDPSTRGRWRRLMVDERGEFVEGKFLKHMLDADRAGLQLTVHAIGDEANHLLLNYLDELNNQNGRRDRRFRLVHAQVIAPNDFKRLGELSVIAEVQPFHLSDDMRWMEERIGRKRCEGAYAFKTIVDSGAPLCFGSDWPGTSAAEYPINPMLALYAAVTRKTVSGEPKGGWFPEQRIGIADAIKAHTYNCAYATFEEDRKGSIEVGKLADLTVLSQNLLEIDPDRILKTEVVFTIVGGRIVFRR